jgi:hypothetical protein
MPVTLLSSPFWRIQTEKYNNILFNIQHLQIPRALSTTLEYDISQFLKEATMNNLIFCCSAIYFGGSAPTFRRNVSQLPQNYMALQDRMFHSSGITFEINNWIYMVNLSYIPVIFYHLIFVKETQSFRSLLCFLHQGEELSSHIWHNRPGVAAVPIASQTK